jgi:polyphosphate kinase
VPRVTLSEPSSVVAARAADLLTPELSLVAFQRRVLAIAEDRSTPLRERLRFLAIVTNNLDELYMVRMADLRADALSDDETVGDDGLTARARLVAVDAAIDSLLREQSRCAADCLRAVEEVGVRLLRWQDLSPEEQNELTVQCAEEMVPALTPLAMTLSPGHPLPHLPHLGLSLAVVFRRSASDIPHLAEIELPSDTPRLIPVPGRVNAVIPIEEVLRANAGLVHPNVEVQSAHLFRVTRRGELSLDEESGEDLLTAVASATMRRPGNPAVRVEVESSMPAFALSLVLESLRRDVANPRDLQFAVQEIDGLLDLRCLTSLPLPDDLSLEYAPFRARSVLDEEASFFDAIRERDLLVHHPFESFDESVLRFIREAARDPNVTGIKITLYRVGAHAPIVTELLAAVRAGKRVYAFVELKARFDEEHNVSWARALEHAGGHVVYGLVGIKAHAKVALVVRTEQGKPRRYVHVGTGNYNTRSGATYTDLSLFSARESLVADIADLFNELTSSSRPPQGLTRGSLVAPHQMLPAILERIEREAEHARAGRQAGITIKVNGLSDREVVSALCRASEAGVEIDLIVRGICILPPGVPEMSSRIRVTSIVGRFLEHSRIYKFENGGAPEYFMGSADLRPRNLRRRVELLVPVTDPEQRARLDRLLAVYLADETAWDLGVDGSYRSRGGALGAQSALIKAAEELPGTPKLRL